MKKLFPLTIGALALTMFAATIYFLYIKSEKKPVSFQTEKPFNTNIIKKTVATGSVIPRKEIAIKPRVSGIVDKIYVTAGQFVKEGELLARVKIVPNMVSLNNAETNFSKSKIVFDDAKKELARE